MRQPGANGAPEGACLVKFMCRCLVCPVVGGLWRDGSRFSRQQSTAPPCRRALTECAVWRTLERTSRGKFVVQEPRVERRVAFVLLKPVGGWCGWSRSSLRGLLSVCQSCLPLLLLLGRLGANAGQKPCEITAQREPRPPSWQLEKAYGGLLGAGRLAQRIGIHEPGQAAQRLSGDEFAIRIAQVCQPSKLGRARLRRRHTVIGGSFRMGSSRTPPFAAMAKNR